MVFFEILEGVKCESCSQAWLIRDNRQYFDIIEAACTTSDGVLMSLEDVDPKIMKDC